MIRISKSTLFMARKLVDEWKEIDVMVLLTALWIVANKYVKDNEIKDLMLIFRRIQHDVSMMELGYE